MTLMDVCTKSRLIHVSLLNRIKVDFTRHPEAVAESRNGVRYQLNPTANWGPKARAGKKQKTDHAEEE